MQPTPEHQQKHISVRVSVRSRRAPKLSSDQHVEGFVEREHSQALAPLARGLRTVHLVKTKRKENNHLTLAANESSQTALVQRLAPKAGCAFNIGEMDGCCAISSGGALESHYCGGGVCARHHLDCFAPYLLFAICHLLFRIFLVMDYGAFATCRGRSAISVVS